MNRREALLSLANGFGSLALTHLLATDAAAESRPEFNGGIHHPAKARRVIQLFMNGGVSQMDTFDYKPELFKRDGQKFDPGAGIHVEAVTSVPGNVMKPPFPFKQYGECGRWVSSVFPNIAKQVDDLAFLMSVKSKTNVHGPASYLMNTGFVLPGFPCMGAWLRTDLAGSRTTRRSSSCWTRVACPTTGQFLLGLPARACTRGTIIRPTNRCRSRTCNRRWTQSTSRRPVRPRAGPC